MLCSRLDPGGIFDKFDDCETGDAVVDRVKDLFRQYIPWDYQWIKNTEFADKKGLVEMSVYTLFQKPVGTLPSGAKVMAMGDMANSLDPIGGQGANNCYRQIRNLLDAVAQHGESVFDESWMNATFDRFYETFGKATNEFNNLLLEEITPAAQRILIAQYGSDGLEGNESVHQRVADTFVDNFDDSTTFTRQMLESEKALEFMNQVSGGRAARVDIANNLEIGKRQLR